MADHHEGRVPRWQMSPERSNLSRLTERVKADSIDVLASWGRA